jgi:hypothetical protein
MQLLGGMVRRLCCIPGLKSEIPFKVSVVIAFDSAEIAGEWNDSAAY